MLDLLALPRPRGPRRREPRCPRSASSAPLGLEAFIEAFGRVRGTERDRRRGWRTERWKYVEAPHAPDVPASSSISSPIRASATIARSTSRPRPRRCGRGSRPSRRRRSGKARHSAPRKRKPSRPGCATSATSNDREPASGRSQGSGLRVRSRQFCAEGTRRTRGPCEDEREPASGRSQESGPETVPVGCAPRERGGHGDRVRIALVHKRYDRLGGAEWDCHELSHQLAARGHEVHLVVGECRVPVPAAMHGAPRAGRARGPR